MENWNLTPYLYKRNITSFHGLAVYIIFDIPFLGSVFPDGGKYVFEETSAARFSRGNTQEIKWKLKELNATPFFPPAFKKRKKQRKGRKKKERRRDTRGNGWLKCERASEREGGEDYDELKIFNFGLRRDWKSYLRDASSFRFPAVDAKQRRHRLQRPRNLLLLSIRAHFFPPSLLSHTRRWNVNYFAAFEFVLFRKTRTGDNARFVESALLLHARSILDEFN